MSRANLHEASSSPDDLELFPEWQEPFTSRRGLSRVFRAGIGSLVVHALVIAVLLTLPETTGRFKGPPLTADFRKTAVPLFAPKIADVTQKEPNKGKVTPQLDIRSSLREAPPKAKAFVPPAPLGPVVPPAATLTPPPQIQAAVPTPPVSGVIPDQAAVPELDFNRSGITQGHIEGSNVNPMWEMSQLIMASRSYDAVSNSMDQSEDSLREAIKALGPSS